MFAAGKTATVSGAAPDDKFNYVTMLLHGDGTNGAQNNTFLDSSTNNFTITRNGNTTQGSFSPYGSNWSNAFDGDASGDNLIAVSANTANAMGSGDWTVEAWIFLNVGGLTPFIMDTLPTTSGATTGLRMRLNASNQLQLWHYSSAILTSSASVSVATWTHVALVKSSGTTTAYINGTASGTYSDSQTYTCGTNRPMIGSDGYNNGSENTLNGYISNLRLVKGTAVYTGNFTPSTTPLTAITNTSLLACQSNRFKDNSSNNFTLTANGTPTVQRFNPFGTSTAYSTSVIGGSGYFDGSGDYLVSPASSSYQFTGDFTIEYWANLSVIDGVMPIGQTYTGNNFQIYYSADGSIEFGGSNLGLVSTSAGVIVKNSWHHGALVRSGSTITLYINGVSKGTITSSSTVGNNATIGIGARPNNAYNCTGYISNVRLVSSAVYTTTFTPPTTPFTAISGTVLLLSTTNGAIFDNAMMNDLETVGNAQISTSVKKYGTGSLAFDGTTDYLQAPTNQIYAFGTGNFTIEFWVYANSWTATASTVVRIAGASDWVCQFDGSGVMNFYANGSAQLVDSGSPSTGVWTHYAIVRSGTSLKMYRSGTSVASATYATSIGASNVLLVGCGGDSNNTLYCLNGYIDDLRITKGYARYTSTFTPPTSALSDTGPY